MGAEGAGSFITKLDVDRIVVVPHEIALAEKVGFGVDAIGS